MVDVEHALLPATAPTFNDALPSMSLDGLCCCAPQEAWRLDSRSTEDIGLAVEIDPDGKAATLDSESLTGYGVSKPLRIGAQVRFVSEDASQLRDTAGSATRENIHECANVSHRAMCKCRTPPGRSIMEWKLM